MPCKYKKKKRKKSRASYFTLEFRTNVFGPLKMVLKNLTYN